MTIKQRFELVGETAKQMSLVLRHARYPDQCLWGNVVGRDCLGPKYLIQFLDSLMEEDK